MLIEYKNHKIFAFSDTHGFNGRLQIPKDADILICAGDCCKDCNQWDAIDEELWRFFDWYSRLPAKLRIYVPGNHDVLFDLNPEEAVKMIPKSIVLLEDSGIEFDGISFYGAVCRPWMFANTENHVPEGIDFLITHGPAEGHFDNNKGCKILKEFINDSKPKFHLFGHIHEEGEKMESTESTTYYNVSMYNQLKYHYQTMKENDELTHRVVKGIEEDIISSFSLNSFDYDKDKCLLSLRRNIINDMVLSHQEDIIDDIREFNDCLREALKEMYDRAHRVYADISKHQDYGDEIELTASLYLGNQYPKLHPVQGEDRQDLWDALCDGGWNVLYDEGICQLTLPDGPYQNSFEAFTGMDCPPPNWNEGLDKELTKDMNLLMQFHHLFDHTEFAITDFIYVREFYSEIKINITKGHKDDE